MARGDKTAYSAKQKRQAEHIEEGYGHRGVPEKEAERRAWATVNKEWGGGAKGGSGKSKPSHVSSRKGGEKAASSRTAEERSRAAKKGWETRRSHSGHKSAA